MNMNRETKRTLARQGADPTTGARKAAAPRSTGAPKRERTSPPEFLREVRQEMRKVAWPTRKEVVNSTIVVLICIVLLTAFIWLVDTGSSHLIRFIYER